METTMMQAIVVAALSFSGAVLAAEEAGNRTQEQATAPAPTPSAQASQPSVKPPSPVKGKQRPKNLDLRYCLELKTSAEVAKCAGEG